MKSFDCARFAAIVDRDATGVAASPQERAFCESHTNACPMCAAEAKLYEVLAGDIQPDHESIEARLPTARLVKWRWRVAIAAAGAAAAAAAVLVTMRGTRSAHMITREPQPQVDRSAMLIEGELGLKQGVTLAEGSTFHTAGDHACLAIAGGVTLCADDGTEIRLLDLTPEHRRVEIVHGRAVASLKKQAPGATFTVETRGGDVTAIGTAFLVDVPETGTVTTHILHGTVLVHGKGIDDQRVTAHHALALDRSKGEPRPLEGLSEEQDWSLIPHDLRLHEEEENDTQSARLSGAYEGLTVHVAPSSTIGTTPASRSLKAHTSGASDDDESQKRVPVGSSTPPSGIPLDVADFLRRARALRAAGRFSEAADAYESLQRTYPRAPEARASLVALGQMELFDLHRPSGALSAFETYLGDGEVVGVLDEEAQAGRIEALHALGREIDERAAIDAFLARYPSSARAPAFRDRRPALR